MIAVNEQMISNPGLGNSDPYGEGWLVEINPEDWDAVKPTLTPSSAVSAPYEAKMAADGFDGYG